MRKPSMVCPLVLVKWTCAMTVLPFLFCDPRAIRAGRRDATGKAGSGHPGKHSSGYSFAGTQRLATNDLGTHSRVRGASLASPSLDHAAIWLRLLKPSLTKMC